MRRVTALLIALPLLVAQGCVSPAPARQDAAIAPIQAQDATAVVQGCGHQPIAGYAYCRKREGSPTTQTIAFIVPPVACQKPACAHLKIFRNDSEVALGLDFPAGQTRLEVPWRSIVGTPEFTTGQRGFWPFVIKIYYLDGNFERTFMVEGEIRLRVYSKEYLPLHESLDDPAFQWEFIESGHKIKMTVHGRTYVAPAR